MDAQRFDIDQRRQASEGNSRMTYSLEDVLSVPPPTPAYNPSMSSLKAPTSPILRAARLALKLIPLSLSSLGPTRTASPASSSSGSSDNLVSRGSLDGVATDDAPRRSWAEQFTADLDLDEDTEGASLPNPFCRPVTPDGPFPLHAPTATVACPRPRVVSAAPVFPSPTASRATSPFLDTPAFFSRSPSPALRATSPSRSSPENPFLDFLSRPTSPFGRPTSPPLNADLRSLPFAQWLPEEDPTKAIGALVVNVSTEVEVFTEDPTI
ncbi:hypothetical protein BV25DRAFT_1827778 [Artomyces pyxidatus]|uniref:Uncharacterized protein n=1 Tax=Artomyces pyxidatus TaxID=48021 RepID=A0ACB8SXL6_9AGAM|nr:hypothetical protein BV25DRAFT_1827778 [Artomyces pyxidatus]